MIATMHVVAITQLSSTVEREAAALAVDLGGIAYEHRQKLAAGLPAVVLTTPDEHRAATLVAKLRARGHVAVACRTADIVASSAMISLRRFQIDDDALIAGDQRLPWREIGALVRATHRRRIETTTVVKDKQLAVGRAIVTGGLVMRKTTTREVATRTDETDPVLYVFRASGATPWLLREQGTHFEALGAQLTPISARNFQLTVELLRSRAPTARFHDALLTRRTVVEELDVLAHVLSVLPTT